MNEIDRLAAIDAIRQGKARYFRGVDSGDGDLVRSVLARDCVLDYRGCCTDPSSGRDFLPAMNVMLRGAASWSADGLSRAGIISVHQSHDCEIAVTGEMTADAVFAMTDRLYMPAGAPFAAMIGYGHYRETWEKTGSAWKIKTLRITRLRVEAV